jgi:hypothetical protein
MGAPQRFTIVPDNYHVPYAGTADGRRFFLSDELFHFGSKGRPAIGYVGRVPVARRRELL